jgi:hypothetical protein
MTPTPPRRKRTPREQLPIPRALVTVYGWLTLVSIGLTVMVLALVLYINNHHHDQAQTNAHFSCSVDGVIDYLRIFNAPATPKQLRTELGVINSEIPGDTANAHLARSVLDALVEAEIANPALEKLHPFVLPDLPCASDPHASH